MVALRGRPVLSVVSARPDGATSIAIGLAGVLSRTGRVALLDLCAHRPEVGVLLDLEDSPNLFELSVVSRLAPVTASDLEAHLQWREGLGVLAGSWLPDPREEISGHFVEGLLRAAAERFDHVIVDLGRAGPELAPAATAGVVAWVVTPSPLGMTALDRALARLDEHGRQWQASAAIILNRVQASSWRDAESFVRLEYGMRIAGKVPIAHECWRGLEHRHSLAPFRAPIPDRKRYVHAYGEDALQVREALEGLAGALLPERPATTLTEA